MTFHSIFSIMIRLIGFIILLRDIFQPAFPLLPSSSALLCPPFLSVQLKSMGAVFSLRHTHTHRLCCSHCHKHVFVFIHKIMNASQLSCFCFSAVLFPWSKHILDIHIAHHHRVIQSQHFLLDQWLSLLHCKYIYMNSSILSEFYVIVWIINIEHVLDLAWLDRKNRQIALSVEYKYNWHCFHHLILLSILHATTYKEY